MFHFFFLIKNVSWISWDQNWLLVDPLANHPRNIQNLSLVPSIFCLLILLFFCWMVAWSVSEFWVLNSLQMSSGLLSISPSTLLRFGARVALLAVSINYVPISGWCLWQCLFMLYLHLNGTPQPGHQIQQYLLWHLPSCIFLFLLWVTVLAMLALVISGSIHVYSCQVN